MSSFELFADGLESPRGLAFDDDDNLHVAEFSKGRVQRFDQTGQHRTVIETGGRPSAVLIDDSGDMFIADAGRRHILLVSPGEGTEVYANQSKGRKFAGPHSLYFSPTGDLLFTDANRNRSEGCADAGTESGAIYSVDLNGDTTMLADSIADPTGIVVSDDALYLYVAESGKNRVLTYEVADDGALEKQEVFVQFDEVAELGFMLFDSEGRLFVARKGIGLTLVDPEGQIVESTLEGSDPGGLCFGGLNFDELFVADDISGRIYHRPFEHPGQRPFVGPRSV